MLPKSPLPWLHIAEVAAQHAVERGYRRIGITGTKWLVDSEVYPEKFAARGLQYVKPSPAERDECNRIIMDELVCSRFTPQGVAYFQQVIARMKDQGCDAVVLGCTEIPLIINDGNSPLPTLDSTRLLARAALEARGGEPSEGGLARRTRRLRSAASGHAHDRERSEVRAPMIMSELDARGPEDL